MASAPASQTAGLALQTTDQGGAANAVLVRRHHPRLAGAADAALTATTDA